MKKFILFTLVMAMSIITYQQFAEAGPGWRGGCGGYGGNQEQTQTPEQIQAREDFYNDTLELREQLFAKRAEYFEVLSQDVPNKELAATIWSEMFDLQTQLRDKAEAAGLDSGFGPGSGPGNRGGCNQGCGTQGGEAPCDRNCDNQTQCNDPSCPLNNE